MHKKCPFFVQLTPELEKLVREKVASGRYHSASEVVRDALRLMEEQDLFRQMKLAALREEIQKGLNELDRGEGTLWNAEEFRKKRVRAEKQNKEATVCQALSFSRIILSRPMPIGRQSPADLSRGWTAKGAKTRLLLDGPYPAFAPKPVAFFRKLPPARPLASTFAHRL